MRSARIPLLADIGLAALAGLVSMGLGVVALRISFGEIGQPWLTGGDDQILHYLLFTSATDAFPFGSNVQLGFPEQLDLFFTAQVDVASAIGISLIGLFVDDGILLLNLFHIVGFFAIACTGYFFLRALRVRPTVSLFFAVVLSIAPFHFQRIAMGHGFLANYWSVPLIGVLILMAAGNSTNPFVSWAERAKTARGRAIRMAIPAIVLCLLVASSGSYYFVFAVIVVGGVWLFSSVASRLRAEPWTALLWPTITTFLLAGLVGIELFVLSLNFGERYSPYFADRALSESEYYAGKITSLLFPWQGTGFPSLKSFTADYNTATGVLLSTEPPGSSIVTSAAMVLIVATILISVVLGTGAKNSRLAAWVRDPRVSAVSIAFMWTLLFFVVTGLGAVVAVIVGPEIRAWSRLGVVLVMLATAFGALIFNEITDRYRLNLVALIVLAPIVLVDQVVGVSAQLPISATPDDEMRSFVAAADKELDDGCGVVQLPLKSFPDSGKIGAMNDYDAALPYLFTQDNNLKWSYGAVGGTYSWDYWRTVDSAELFEAAVDDSEACAIEVDLNGYTESVGDWEEWVDRVADAGEPTTVSSTGRYLLFEVP